MKINAYSLKTLLTVSCALLLGSAAEAQYCTSGLYSYGTNYGDYINSVYTTGGTSNISYMNSGNNGGSSGYSYNTSYGTLTVQLGQSFTIFAINNPSYGEHYGIWLDLDGNGVFSSSEQLYNSGTGTVGASSTAGGSSGISYTVPTTATPGNTRIRVRCVWYYSNITPCGSYGGGEVEDYPVTLVAACPNPVISAQPQNRLSCETATTNFSVTATNASTYQWQVNTGSAWANVSGSVYSGATTSNLTLSNIPLNYNNYQYRCIVTGACNNPVTSGAATLTVNPGVSILSQTISDSICEGANTSVSVTANGSATNYQWEMAVATVGVFSNVPNSAPFSGATSPTLNISNVPGSLGGYLFRCTVTGGLCPSAVSDNIPFTVLTSPVFAENPVNDTIVFGYSAHFSTSATSPNVVYYWQASADGINYSNINNNSLYQGVTTPNLEVFAGWPLNNWWFRAVIKSTDPACGLYRDTSEPAQLLIIGPNAINSIAKAGKLDVTVYPNPASGSEIYVSASHLITGILQSKVIDKLGRTLYSADIDLSKNRTAPVSVEQLPAGIYTLQLTNAEGDIQNINFTRQ